MRVVAADLRPSAAQAVVDGITAADRQHDSSAVWMGETERVSYQAAKGGLIELTRHTASLGGKHGVRANLVSPGVILTGAALANTTEEWRAQILATVRSPRLGDPADLAGMVAFLFSADAAYVDGQSFLVDGGANFT